MVRDKSLIVLDGVSGISGISLLDEGKLDSTLSREGDQRLLALSDNEDVAETGGEGLTTGILNVGNLVGTGVVLDVLEDTDTTDVVSALDEDRGSVLEFDESVDLTTLKVKLDKSKY